MRLAKEPDTHLGSVAARKGLTLTPTRAMRRWIGKGFRAAVRRSRSSTIPAPPSPVSDEQAEIEMTFGCEQCYGPDAKKVWESQPYEVVGDLHPGSHFSVDIKRCTTCGQLFVQVFTEFIDWGGGKDAMYWDTVPIRPDEAEYLASHKSDYEYIGNLGRGRRRLVYDWPTKAEEPSYVWAVGAFTVMPV